MPSTLAPRSLAWLGLALVVACVSRYVALVALGSSFLMLAPSIHGLFPRTPSHTPTQPPIPSMPPTPTAPTTPPQPTPPNPLHHHTHSLDGDDMPAPPNAPGVWDQVYEINGQQVSLNQVQAILNQNLPKYGGDVVCANEDGSCCPAYCCSVKNTIHDLQVNAMNESFRLKETSALYGEFQVLSKQELFTQGTFAAVLFKDFAFPIFGGWTLELNFNKPVFDLHSFNAKVVGTANGAKSFFLRPMFWNRNVPAGPRRLLVQGLTTPEKDDGVALVATGALWYDPREQAVNLNPPPFVPEPRPVVPPPAVPGERYNLGEVLQLSILFYEAQRSGKLPKGNRVLWRGDSGVDDKTDDGKDLSGGTSPLFSLVLPALSLTYLLYSPIPGWYDAGDHIKLGVPMAYSATILLWGVLRYPDAFAAAGELDNMRDAVRWPLDYFIKAHTKKRELYVQVSDQGKEARVVWFECGMLLLGK